jgi:glucose/arabinose dehydrogenase
MRAFTRLAALAAAAFFLGTPAVHAAVAVPAGFDQRVLADGLTQPTQIAWAPDGRAFVTEKGGRIRVITAAGNLKAAPLLDIRSRVNQLQDRGLLGIAVSPDFATDRQLYYAYTYDLAPSTPDGDAPMVARVERVTVNADDTVGATTVVMGQDVSSPCPRVSDSCMPSDGRSHSIGTIRFGPDGTLWVGLGDSASYAEVDDLAFRAQEEGGLAGKILHVDTNGHGLPGHPFCPSTTDLTKACTKIFAKGFRNPYRFTLDGNVPMVGDVGWGSREELDRVVAGGNYGWPCWEGDRQTTGYSSDPRCTSLYAAGGVKAPLYSYSHDNATASIIGGPVMPASSPFGAGYAGDVFIADYAKNLVQRVRLAPDRTCTTTPCTVVPFATGWAGGTDLELSPGGNLAWALFGTGGADGSVTEVVPAGANRTPVAEAAAAPLPNTAGLGFRFSSSASSDPDGDALTARWDFGDGSATVTGATVDHTYAASVTRATVKLTVSDGRGASATDTVVVTPGDQAPSPQISAPTQDQLFADGQPVTLRGSAADAEDGALGGSSLVWHVVLHHGTHVHVLNDVTGTEASFTPFDDHDADTTYSVTLTATDSAGNSVETAPVTLRPRKVALTLRSDPPGASIGFGEAARTTPVTFDAAVGFRTTLTAPATFTAGGQSYRFVSWSDGGAAQHPFVVPGTATTLTATYAPAAGSRENKALARAATASASHSATYAPDKAVDGSGTTRWSSTFADNQWWRVDLGAARAVDGVRVDWEAAFATRYLVETSTDAVTWSTAADVTIAAKGVKESSFASRTARYVRITALTRATVYGASFWEVGVFGPDDATAPPPPPPTPPPPPPPTGSDLARAGTASASSSHSASFSPAYGNDANATTRWSSAFADNQWWQVDLRAPATVGRVLVTWERAYASAYDVQTSMDGVTFTTAASATATADGPRTTTFTPRSARYVRIVGRTRATVYGISFFAFEVYGS